MEPESPSAAYDVPDSHELEDGGNMAMQAQMPLEADEGDEDFEPDPNMETLDLSG